MKKHFGRGKTRSIYIQKIMILTIIFSFFISINSVASSEENEGSMITVSSIGVGNFSSIQEAIDAADPGDTIYVYNGTYFENMVIDKSLTLIGENNNNTIIDGRSTGNAVKVNADYVTIQGFTITHSGLTYPLSGINLSSDYNVVQDNIIMNNYYGMTLYLSSDNTISNNIVQNNDHCGIYMSKSTNNTITNNTIQYHTYNGIGVYYSSDANLIHGNNFSNNGFCGVNIRISSDNNVIGNNLSDNNIGIHLPQTNTVNDNTFSNNQVDIERELFSSEPETFIVVGVLVVIIIAGVIIYIKIKKK
jgi:parallel beta-helix repeat protein